MHRAYEQVVARLIEAIGSGIIPWRKPWQLPLNALSFKAYRGINFLVLATADYADPRFVTFLQAAKELGGHVRRGEKGFPVVKWHFPSAQELQEDPDAKPWAKGYTVFNVEQCENLEKLPELPSIERDSIADAQAIVDSWTDRPRIEFGGYQAAYSPILDRVIMPEMEKFRSSAEFYDTLFHECVHATGSHTRLDRELTPRFDTEKYGIEELIAEIGAAMLCAEAGIDNSDIVENNAAYLQSWLRVISADPSMLVKAASKAAQAADLILGRGQAFADSEEAHSQQDVLLVA